MLYSWGLIGSSCYSHDALELRCFSGPVFLLPPRLYLRTSIYPPLQRSFRRSFIVYVFLALKWSSSDGFRSMKRCTALKTLHPLFSYQRNQSRAKENVRKFLTILILTYKSYSHSVTHSSHPFSQQSVFHSYSHSCSQSPIQLPIQSITPRTVCQSP